MLCTDRIRSLRAFRQCIICQGCVKIESSADQNTPQVVPLGPILEFLIESFNIRLTLSLFLLLDRWWFDGNGWLWLYKSGKWKTQTYGPQFGQLENQQKQCGAAELVISFCGFCNSSSSHHTDSSDLFLKKKITLIYNFSVWGTRFSYLLLPHVVIGDNMGAFLHQTPSMKKKNLVPIRHLTLTSSFSALPPQHFIWAASNKQLQKRMSNTLPSVI